MPPKAKTFAKTSSFAALPSDLAKRITIEAGKNIITRPSASSVQGSGHWTTEPMYFPGIGVVEGPPTYHHTRQEQNQIMHDALDYVNTKYFTGNHNSASNLSKQLRDDVDVKPKARAKPKAKPSASSSSASSSSTAAAKPKPKGRPVTRG